MMFSTKDRDNDKLEDSHCAFTYTGKVVGSGEDVMGFYGCMVYRRVCLNEII